MTVSNRGRVVGLGPNDFGPERVTKYNELHYQRQGAGNWRLIDTSTSRVFGSPYRTQEALLSDLDRQYRTRFTNEPEPAKNWTTAMLLQDVQANLTEIANHYEHSAPTVTTWANDLYIRLGESLDKVTVLEIMAVDQFRESDQWEPSSFAANRVYKLMNRLGQDTTGHAGF